MNYLLLNDFCIDFSKQRFDNIGNPDGPSKNLQFSSADQQKSFLGSAANTSAEKTKPASTTTPAPDNLTASQERPHLQNQIAVGGEYVAGSHNGKNYIINKDGRIIVQFDKSQYIDASGTRVFVAHVPGTTEFSGGSIQDTHVLLVSDKLINNMKSRSQEVQAGYKPGESVDMVLGHEIVHTKINTMPQAQKDELTAWTASKWGQVHEFAAVLLMRADYRKGIVDKSRIILAKNPDARVRSVTVDGEVIPVAVEAVMDELLAYHSGNVLLGVDRMRELAVINPTHEVPSRELLSQKAGEVVSQLRSVSTPPVAAESLYATLPQDIVTVTQTIGNFIRS